MRILVTGGAGYIGSFMVKSLFEKGHEVIILDSLERSTDKEIDSRAKFVKANILDKEFLHDFFANNQIDGIIHFAALISMGESMQNPYIYFLNNTTGTLNLIEAATKAGVKKIIFSSTAGVYGNPEHTPIPESHPKNPTNPYGESKLMVEKILAWYQQIYGLNFAALRYFNACGAALDGSMGEAHEPETHIIPNAIKAVMKDHEFALFGTDYNTPDGTAVRDYIHVLDLAEAHILALEKLETNPGAYYFNVGTGNGYSNKEIVSELEKVTGKQLKVREEGRRPGDADILVADVTKIKNELGFTPAHSDLNTIISSAWKWHSKQ